MTSWMKPLNCALLVPGEAACSLVELSDLSQKIVAVQRVLSPYQHEVVQLNVALDPPHALCHFHQVLHVGFDLDVARVNLKIFSSLA